jgi:hypothetical protein
MARQSRDMRHELAGGGNVAEAWRPENHDARGDGMTRVISQEME